MPLYLTLVDGRLVQAELPTSGGGFVDAWRGEWLAPSVYAEGDLVKHDGSAWLALASSQGREPGGPAESPLFGPFTGDPLYGWGRGSNFVSVAASSPSSSSTCTVSETSQVLYPAGDSGRYGTYWEVRDDTTGALQSVVNTGWRTSRGNDALSVSRGAAARRVYAWPGLWSNATASHAKAQETPVAEFRIPALSASMSNPSGGDAWTLLVEVGDPGPPGPAGPAGPAGSGYARSSFTGTTGLLQLGASENITVAGLGPAARLLSVSTDVPARLRVYASAADRTADANRPLGTDPTGDHGLMLEYVTAPSQLSGRLSPLVDWWNSAGGSDLYMAVTNLDDSAAAVTATITYLRTE